MASFAKWTRRSSGIRKVRGDVNPADLFTKYFSSEVRVTELLRLVGFRFVGGRAEGAPQLRRKAGVSRAGVLAVETVVGPEADSICQEGWAYRTVELADCKGQSPRRICTTSGCSRMRS